RAHQHRQAVLRAEAHRGIPLAPHGTAHLRLAVLQREIPVARGGRREVRQLPLEPQQGQAGFQQQPDFLVEPRNRVNVALGARRGRGASRFGREEPGRFSERGGIVHAPILTNDCPKEGSCVQSRMPTNPPSMRILEEALTFDDVLLVPAYSEILPREVDLGTRLTKAINLNLPLVSAAMDTVTEARLAITMAQEGGIGIVHKSMTIDGQAAEVARVKKFESGVIRDPITVSPDMTIRQVIDLTRSKGISGVPVVQGKQVVGIVTHRDLRFEVKLDAPVSSVMTPKERLVTVRENAPKDEVLLLLHKHRIEKVLVVNGEQELRGMIT